MLEKVNEKHRPPVRPRVECSEALDFLRSSVRFPYDGSRSFSRAEKAEYLNLVFFQGCLNNMWSKAVRRQLLTAIDYPDEIRNVRMGEDLLQSLFILDNAESAYYLEEPIYYYRPNCLSATHSFKPGDVSDAECIHSYISVFLRRWKDVPGFTLTEDDNDADLLMRVYQCLKAAASFSSTESLTDAIARVHSSDVVKDAFANGRARSRVRLDAALVLGCIVAGRLRVAETLLRAIVIAAGIKNRCENRSIEMVPRKGRIA